MTFLDRLYNLYLGNKTITHIDNVGEIRLKKWIIEKIGLIILFVEKDFRQFLIDY